MSRFTTSFGAICAAIAVTVMSVQILATVPPARMALIDLPTLA